MAKTHTKYRNLTELNDINCDFDSVKFSYCKFPTFSLSTDKVTSLTLNKCEIETIICPPELTDLCLLDCKVSKIICNEKLKHLTIFDYQKYDPIIENLPETLITLSVDKLVNKIPSGLTTLYVNDESLIQLILTGQLESYSNLHCINHFSPWNQPAFKKHVVGLMSESIPFEKIKDLYVECKYGVDSEKYNMSKEKIDNITVN